MNRPVETEPGMGRGRMEERIEDELLYGIMIFHNDQDSKSSESSFSSSVVVLRFLRSFPFPEMEVKFRVNI